MLFYKLLEYNIDGKIYKSIKALYNHPLSKVKVNILPLAGSQQKVGLDSEINYLQHSLLFILMT